MFTENQVISLAPDAPSIKAGKKLAISSKWTLLANSDNAIWGEIKGSGKNPYQIRVDTTEIAFKCSCPSRKFPCKHGLALLFVYVNEHKSFAKTSEPEWVSTWLNQRKSRATAKKEKANKPVDEKARQKRVAKREEKVKDGMAEVQKWILDTVRNGIAQFPDNGPGYFEKLAARMVDAQAPGIASQFRALGNLNYQKEDWQVQVLDRICGLWMVAAANQHFDKLTPSVQEELKAIIGWNTSKEELTNKAGIVDSWQLLGMEVFEENRITVQKYWITGANTGKQAYILQYIVPGQLREFSLVPGMAAEAELVFYGEGISKRAIFKQINDSTQITKLSGFSKLDECKAHLAEEIGQNPWLTQLGVVLEEITPVSTENTFLIVDQNQQTMPLDCPSETMWKLLAISGGKPVIMAGLYDCVTFIPFGIMVNGQYQLLTDGAA